MLRAPLGRMPLALRTLALWMGLLAVQGAASAGKLALLQARTDQSIAATRQGIRRLKKEIKALEKDHEEKERLARKLGDDIVLRKGEIERNVRRTETISIFGALAGMPMVAAVGLVKMQQDDVRLQELNRRLTVVRAEQDSLNEKIRAHEATKASLKAELKGLKRSEKTIVAEVERVRTALDAGPRSLEQARATLGLSRVLLSNLRGQVGLLETIRRNAAELSEAFDGHLRFLEKEIAGAERLVAESTQAYLDYLKVVLSRDPNAAAGRWLEKGLVKRAATMLHEAGLEPEVAQQLAQLLIPRGASAATARRFSGAVGDEVRAQRGSFVNPVNLLGGTTNCGDVSLALAHRLRGRNVVALPGSPVTLEEIGRLANASFVEASTDGAAAELARRGDGADAIAFGQRPGDPIGHVWNVVNRGGRIVHLDGQNWTGSSTPPMPVRAVMVLPRGERWPAPPGYPDGGG